MKALKFPEDFVIRPHFIPGAQQWLYSYNDNSNDMISIVGGGIGINGDGEETFEMWDTKNMMDPMGYMSREDIQKWFEDHPIEGE
jgi:hypothetical protein